MTPLAGDPARPLLHAHPCILGIELHKNETPHVLIGKMHSAPPILKHRVSQIASVIFMLPGATFMTGVCACDTAAVAQIGAGSCTSSSPCSELASKHRRLVWGTNARSTGWSGVPPQSHISTHNHVCLYKAALLKCLTYCDGQPKPHVNFDFERTGMNSN